MKYQDINTITINGERLQGDAIVKYCTESGREDLSQLGLFVKKWLSENPDMILQTSGSTGEPKTMRVQKDQMLASAAMTAEYFGFKEGQKTLLCLPIRYIAGKMMVVRAMLSELNLICVAPSGNPLAVLPEETIIDFAPLLPIQLDSVESAPGFKKILLGGAPVAPRLEGKLQSFSARIFHGYGMTETLSHVALRRVNGPDKSEVYEALKGIAFEQDNRDCLVIQVPFLTQPVVTNDVVELLSSTSFTWRGRADFVVNSGGVKLFPEEIERKIGESLSLPFFVAGIPDERFGERLCLFIESTPLREDKLDDLNNLLHQRLDTLERPRKIIFVPVFERTDTGKVDRKGTVRGVI